VKLSQKNPKKPKKPKQNKKTLHGKELVEWLKVWALSSRPSTAKKKKKKKGWR
jgi:hypothetical protein